VTGDPTTIPFAQSCVRCGGPVHRPSVYVGAAGPFCAECSNLVSEETAKPRGPRETFVGWLMSLVMR